MLLCNYIQNTYSVFSKETREVIEVFKLNEFKHLKSKYFPFADISFYENSNIEISGLLTDDNSENTSTFPEYRTEAGTITDNSKIHLLNKYKRYVYEQSNLKKIEYYDNKKLASVDFYLSDQQQEDSFYFDNAPTNYTLVKEKKITGGYLLELKSAFKNSVLTGRVVRLKDSIGHTVCEEYYPNNDKQPNYSKTKKSYYSHHNGLVLFDCTYQKDGLLDVILLYNNEPPGKIVRFDYSSWSEFKNYLFPNENISFYEAAANTIK